MSFIPIMLFKEKISFEALLASCSVDTCLSLSRGYAADQSPSLGVDGKSVRSYNSFVFMMSLINDGKLYFCCVIFNLLVS